MSANINSGFATTNPEWTLGDLKCEQMYSAGAWRNALSGKTFDVFNPVNQEIVGSVPDCDGNDLEIAIESAHKNFYVWSRLTAGHRASLLQSWRELILEHLDPLSQLLTIEQGKPITEAIGEIRYAASFVEFAAEQAKRVNGEIIPPHLEDKRVLVYRQPIGVVAAITPWNFPAAMVTRKIAPALAAGCSVIIKPAAQTPLIALAFAKLAEQAGIPAGVINVVTTQDAENCGRLFASDPRIAKISFTGSTAVGKKLMAASASSLKKLSLELGGNAPFLVFEDADLDAAVSGAIASKFRNSGQTCICANRFLIQESVLESFLEKLVNESSCLRLGNGLMRGIDQGPLISQQAVERLDALVKEAIDMGAKLLCGGKVHALGGTFYEPTVLTNVTSEMRLAREEIFGPVAPVMTFRDEDEAIAIANQTRYGLAAYFYTNDLKRFWKLSEQLEFGVVGHNTGMISTEIAPFGGIKESGMGREGSQHGINEFTELKYVCSEIS